MLSSCLNLGIQYFINVLLQLILDITKYTMSLSILGKLGKILGTPQLTLMSMYLTEFRQKCGGCSPCYYHHGVN